MYRASRALAAGIAAVGLSACQLPVNPQTQSDERNAAPVQVTEPAAEIESKDAVPVTADTDSASQSIEVQTVTIVEERPSAALKEILQFTTSPATQAQAIARYRQAFLDSPTEAHGLQLGLALAVSAADENTINESTGLLSRVSRDNPDYALARLMMDQSQKQLSLLNVESAPGTADVPKSSDNDAVSPQTSALMQREQNLRQREIELLERERAVADTRGENFRLRQRLAQAEQKLRELAQIEVDLARTSEKTQP